MKNSLFIFTSCLPHHFLPIHWDQTMIILCQSLGSRPMLVQELFTVVPRLFGTTSGCLPVQFLPLINIWRHISSIWPFSHRYRHSPWPVDVTKLFLRFCCWTLIWLSHHWAWLRRGYWRYRSLIDCNPQNIKFIWELQNLKMLYRESQIRPVKNNICLVDWTAWSEPHLSTMCFNRKVSNTWQWSDSNSRLVLNFSLTRWSFKKLAV